MCMDMYLSSQCHCKGHQRIPRLPFAASTSSTRWVAWKTLDEAIILKCNYQWQASCSIKDDESDILTLAMFERCVGREYQYLWPLTGYLAARLAAMSRSRVMLSIKPFVVSLESMPSEVPVGLLLQGGSGMNVCILIECLPCSVLCCPSEYL